MPSRATNNNQPFPLRRFYLPVSIALYILAFPGLVPGTGLLAFCALVPALLWLEQARPVHAAIFGFAFGALTYTGITYWLIPYHLAALGLSIGLAAFWFAALFFILALLLSSRRWILALAVPIVWTAVEIGRSSGFLGFPYGTLPYALYRYDLALRLASVGGVVTVGLVIVSANLGFYLSTRRFLIQNSSAGISAPAGKRRWLQALPASIGALVMLVVAIAGYPRPTDAVTRGDPSMAPANGIFRVALIQPNIRKAQKTPADYASAIAILTDLSERALGGSPGLVAWHETAVVPPLEWHLRHRPDRAIYEPLAVLKTFLGDYPVPLLIGNGWADPNGLDRTVGGNATVLYERGIAKNYYIKMRLVPFSEYFPYEKTFPGLARWLVYNFGYFWIPGTEHVLFRVAGMSFATPICFEDSFGEHVADFDEPDFFIVQTNDAWAKSAAMQEQHLSMSAFRAAETGTVVLRVANTGSTAALAPNGSVVAVLPPFETDILLADIRKGTGSHTLYERGGRHIESVIWLSGLALGILACFRAFMIRARRRAIVSD
ncbi:MAG: apolipoprotein N-acyltransferase [Spirochaetales bacterium]|nr:MAG: apolipoprotein N-acyltransferase [Spirochaetales bacterium]